MSSRTARVASLRGHLFEESTPPLFFVPERALRRLCLWREATSRGRWDCEVTVGSHCPPRARGRASCRAGPGTGTVEGGSPVASTLLPALPSPAPPRSGPRPAPAPRPALGRLRPRVWPPRAQCRGHFQRPLAARQRAAHRQPRSGVAASRETPHAVPGVDRAVNRRPRPPRDLLAQTRTACALGRRPRPTPGPRAEVSLGDSR